MRLTLSVRHVKYFCVITERWIGLGECVFVSSKSKKKKKADRQSDGQFVFLLTVWPGRKKSIDSTYPVPVRVLKRLERKTQLSSMCIYICVCVLLISIMYCFFSGRERCHYVSGAWPENAVYNMVIILISGFHGFCSDTFRFVVFHIEYF